MYKIIGADQKEYGPVSAEQVRQWMSEGRVNAATLMQGPASPDWKPLSTFPEFAAPPLTGMPPLTPAPIIVPPSAPRRTNGMATTGLIMGILSIVCPCCGCLFSILGIIFSLIALSDINRNPQQDGKGMAIAGLILSIGGIFSGLFWSLVLNVPLHGRFGHFHFPR